MLHRSYLTFLLYALAVNVPAPASAQPVPGTDILLMRLPVRQAAEQGVRITNVTHRDGYDNQPFFLSDGKTLLYTSIREDEQADIYRLEVPALRHLRLTITGESEYSPTELPSGDGFSVVRVEEDGRQRLWAFDADGKNPRLLMEHVEPVGYHAWADTHRVALFVLGADGLPPTLQLVDLQTGHIDTVAHDIGRSLHRVPGTNAISFVHKETENRWVVKTVDPATGSIETLVETLPGQEDYAWTPDGRLLMAENAVLYDWTSEQDTWERLIDFSGTGVTRITRLAVDPNARYLALVVDRPQ